MNDFTKVKVPSITASELIARFVKSNEELLYIKIDLEGFDSQILVDLFNHGFYPNEISAESHSIDIFAELVSSGVYKSFSLIEGSRVQSYSWINSENTELKFLPHSAGPFGSDIVEDWFDADTFFQLLALKKLGWKDIHASRQENNYSRALGRDYILKTLPISTLSRIYQEIFPYQARKLIFEFRTRCTSMIKLK